MICHTQHHHVLKWVLRACSIHCSVASSVVVCWQETCDVYRCCLMFRLYLRKAVKWRKVVENGGEVVTPANLPAR